MTTYYVATLARYVLVDAENETGPANGGTRLSMNCTPTSASDSVGRFQSTS